MTKYKELVTKLQSNLQKEFSKQKEMLSRISELESKYQPLKEKLHESENTVRRIGNEKRSLEVQLLHATAQMKEIKKQWERESFGVSIAFWLLVNVSISKGVRSDFWKVVCFL